MSWDYSFTTSAKKQLERLERKTQSAILAYLDQRVLGAAHPKQQGKALVGDLSGLWRYRVGDYRLICQIQDEVVTVLVLKVSHRKDVYR